MRRMLLFPVQFGDWVWKCAKRADCFTAATKAVFSHCICDSNIFTTVNFTHLTVGDSKFTKIHKAPYSCVKGEVLCFCTSVIQWNYETQTSQTAAVIFLLQWTSMKSTSVKTQHNTTQQSVILPERHISSVSVRKNKTHKNTGMSMGRKTRIQDKKLTPHQFICTLWVFRFNWSNHQRLHLPQGLVSYPDVWPYCVQVWTLLNHKDLVSRKGHDIMTN